MGRSLFWFNCQGSSSSSRVSSTSSSFSGGYLGRFVHSGNFCFSRGSHPAPPGGRSSGRFLAPRNSSPCSRGSYKPGGPPPRGRTRKNLGRSAWGDPLGSPYPGGAHRTPPVIKSTWKGISYTIPGSIPLGGHLVWTSQVGVSLLVRSHHNRGSRKNPAFQEWNLQTSRPYYLTAPLGVFRVNTPRGRPQRTKWKNK